jgi:hypothetical protein
MPKKRDLARAWLDRWVPYLRNPENLEDKTAEELAKEMLADLPKFKEKGGQYKWGTEAELEKVFSDICELGDQFPSPQKLAVLLQEKYPPNADDEYSSDPEYDVELETLTKQLRILGRELRQARAYVQEVVVPIQRWIESHKGPRAQRRALMSYFVIPRFKAGFELLQAFDMSREEIALLEDERVRRTVILIRASMAALEKREASRQAKGIEGAHSSPVK